VHLLVNELLKVDNLNFWIFFRGLILNCWRKQSISLKTTTINIVWEMEEKIRSQNLIILHGKGKFFRLIILFPIKYKMKERNSHVMKQRIHNIVMSECNMLWQIAVAPTPSVCFKYALIFLSGLAIRASNSRRHFESYCVIYSENTHYSSPSHAPTHNYSDSSPYSLSLSPPLSPVTALSFWA